MPPVLVAPARRKCGGGARCRGFEGGAGATQRVILRPGVAGTEGRAAREAVFRIEPGAPDSPAQRRAGVRAEHTVGPATPERPSGRRTSVTLLCIGLRRCFSWSSPPAIFAPTPRRPAPEQGLRARLQPRECRVPPSPRSVPRRAATLRTRSAARPERPAGTPRPPDSRARGRGFVGAARALRRPRPRLAGLAASATSWISRLCSMEHVQEYCHTQACQQMNSRCQQRYRSNSAAHKTQYVNDEACRQQNGQQNHPDQCDERRILDAHLWSIRLPLPHTGSASLPRTGVSASPALLVLFAVSRPRLGAGAALARTAAASRMLRRAVFRLGVPAAWARAEHAVAAPARERPRRARQTPVHVLGGLVAARAFRRPAGA